ncbi:alpha/beta fold hydrolase [Phormidesmis sp. 146-12]
MAQATAAGNVRIDYDDLGQGDSTILLMTAWCMSRSGYGQLAQKLAKNNRVLTFDWRGHGKSETPTGDFGANELVEDAIAVIQASGAQEITLVSMHHAGWVAIDLRRRLGSKIARIVHLDWVVFPPPDPYMNLVRGLASPDGWQQARDTLFTIWTNGIPNPPELVSFIKEEMGSYRGEMWMRSGREIAAGFDQFGSPLQALSQLNPPVPTLHLYGQPKDPGYLVAQQNFAFKNSWFSVHQLNAESFFAQFDADDEIVTAVEEFLAKPILSAEAV